MLYNQGATCRDATAVDGHELWQGNRLVARTGDGAGGVPADHQIDAAQHVVLQIEESLQNCHWRIAQSAKLPEETSRLKQRLASR